MIRGMEQGAGSKCPHDTDGDGNCGYAICPVCHPEFQARSSVIQCGMERLVEGKLVRCPERARWEHPRYPDGGYCDRHRKMIAEFFPNGWTEIRPDASGEFRRFVQDLRSLAGQAV